MMHWTCTSEIERDLSLAQGRDVPIVINRTIGDGDKPPTPQIHEETEEEYFDMYCGDGDVTEGPDLNRIKEMLNMVRETNGPSDDEANDGIMISKLNPTAEEFIPTTNEKHRKNRKQRNAALESLLNKIEGERDKPEQEPLLLLNPNHFLKQENQEHTNVLVTEEPPTRQHLDSIEKVSSWLRNNNTDSLPKKSLPVCFHKIDMFKIKKDNVPSRPEKPSDTSNKAKQTKNAVFKPSTMASEYYKKYLEKNKLMQELSGDIWTNAEKQMKDIEEKRKKEAEKQACQNESA